MSGKKPYVVAGAVATLVLLVVGFVNGAIGSAMLGSEQLLDAPHVELAAPTVIEVGGFGITNTMLSAWLTTLVLIVVLGLGARGKSVVPRGLQNFVEWILESLYNFTAGVAGERFGRAFFPVIATIFLFVAFNAWMALFPIYPTLFIEHGGEASHLLRSAGTDLNMPLALALVSFVFTEAWGFKAHGVRYLGDFFRFGELLRGLARLSPGRMAMGILQIFVGLIELVSHFIRIVSFTFRLFGNMTAGEVVLLMTAFLVSFVFTLPFYGLELLVGFIQALIFAGLTLAFVVVAVSSHEEEPER